MKIVWNSWALFSVLMVMLLAAGCGADPQPLVFGPPAWSGGEVSQYQVTDRTGKLAGSATVSLVAGTERGPDGWTFHREIAAGEAEDVTVEMTAKGYIPTKSDLIRTDSGGTQKVETVIDRSQVDIVLTDRNGTEIDQRVSVPSDIRDERTLLTIARALPLAEGYATQLNSFLPVVGVVERLTIEVSKRERVDVPAGEYDTWLVEFSTQDRTTQAWIGVDVPHPVVKFIDARSKGLFELTKFTPGE